MLVQTYFMGGFSIIVLMGMLVPIFLIYILIRVGITVAVIGISILYPVATIGLLIAAIVYFIISIKKKKFIKKSLLFLIISIMLGIMGFFVVNHISTHENIILKEFLIKDSLIPVEENGDEEYTYNII